MELRMTKTDNPFAAFDLNKMLGDLKLPGFDPAAVAAAQQKNLDAIAAANRKVIEGYQAVARRQAEIFQENLKEAAAMIKSTPDVNAAKQADAMRQALEKAIAQLRELAEMAAKANTDAYETITQRMNETMEDFRKSFNKTGK
jgi:phasin family protein